MADEDGVVFLAAAEDLGNAFQFLGTAHYWVEATFISSLGEVAAEILECWGLAFAAGVVP